MRGHGITERDIKELGNFIDDADLIKQRKNFAAIPLAQVKAKKSKGRLQVNPIAGQSS